MTINDSNTIKDFGYGLSTKDVISLITIILGNDYNSFFPRSEVDTIDFEIRCTDMVAAIVEVINPYLQSFKLSLTMDTRKYAK